MNFPTMKPIDSDKKKSDNEEGKAEAVVETAPVAPVVEEKIDFSKVEIAIASLRHEYRKARFGYSGRQSSHVHQILQR